MHRRPWFNLVGSWVFLAFLILGPTAASAAECPISGSGYMAPYNSPIGLPRCSGTIGRWTTCEVCLISDGSTYTEQDAYMLSYPTSGTGLQPRATFQGATSLTVDGFFDGLTNGRAVFRVRFAPTTNSGTWSFSTTSSDPGLQHAGSFTAGTSTSKGFLRRDSSYPQSFIWDNATHPYLWGQTYYQIVNQARTGNNSLWQTPVTNSASYGMNKIRLLVSPWGGDPRYQVESKAFQKNGDGTLNRDKLDVNHWKTLDRVVSFLHGQGMVADLIIFEDSDTFGTTVQNRRYTRYTVARYAAFPSVIWTLSNEYQLVTGTSGPFPSNQANNGPWNDLGCLIRGGCGVYATGADPWAVSGSVWRPLSNHNNINTTDINRPRNLSYPCFEFFTAGWPDHISLQTKRGGTTPDAEAFTAVSRNSNLATNVCPGLSSSTRLPVIDDEYYYIGTTGDPTDRTRHRQAVWAIAAAGGFGSTGSLRGPSGCGGVCSPALYTTWQDEPAYGDIRAVTRFFTNYVPNWWRMSGDLNIPGQSRVYALSEPGVHFMVYSAQGSTVTLNVPTPPAGRQWSYCFIGPQSGFCTDKVLRLTGGGTRTFTMPDGNDWAMLFDVF